MMPIPPELRKYYGTKWRKWIRPAALRRANYKCVRCFGHRRSPAPLEVAHLDQDPANMADDNLAALCRRCQRAHDNAAGARKCRETRSARKDAARPLLAEEAQ
jgi:hypothetical protein